MNFRGHLVRDILNEGPRGSYWWDYPGVPMHPGDPKLNYWDYLGVPRVDDPKLEHWDYPGVLVNPPPEASTDEPAAAAAVENAPP